MHKEALVIYGCMLIAFMLPLLYRAVVGPTTIDRMIGVNIIGTKTTILLLVVGLIFEDPGHSRDPSTGPGEPSSRFCQWDIPRAKPAATSAWDAAGEATKRNTMIKRSFAVRTKLATS